MDKPIVLDGHSLTTAQIAAIARSDVPVELAPPAMERASEARKVVLELSNSKRPIYGLNTGLGANKDNRIEPEQYHRFNTCILHSHSVALPPIANRDVKRATMLCRLNGLLTGMAGVNLEILYLLRDMLNYRIHPQIPERGSVGMSDLGNMAYLALPLIGEGYVELHGEILPAGEALNRCGLSPVQLGPKDGLPLVSSNAFSVAKAALLCEDTDALLHMADAVYATGYEALGYNPMFLDTRGISIRPMEGHRQSLTYVHSCLNGSKLWNSGNESLAGALSYKSGCSIHGAVWDSLHYIQTLLPAYINSSDDCPAVLTREKEIISTDHFIVTGLAIAFEMLDIALAHLSKTICNRILRLDNEHFSGLPRFLRPEREIIAYSTIQKTVSALDGEIRHLANPASLDYLPTANESEDHGCNTPYVMGKTEKFVDLLRYLIGIEAMHSAPSADLAGGRPSGRGTGYIYDAVRQAIPFLEDDDRDLGADMQRAYQLVLEKKLLYQEEPFYAEG